MLIGFDESFLYIQILNICTSGLNIFVLRLWTFLYFGCQRTLYSVFCVLILSGRVAFFPFIFKNRNLKTKYLKNRPFKWRTVFNFELLASRSSKLDPILICFDELFFCLSVYCVLVVLCTLYTLFCLRCTSCSVYSVRPVSVYSVHPVHSNLYTLVPIFCTFCSVYSVLSCSVYFVQKNQISFKCTGVQPY